MAEVAGGFEAASFNQTPPFENIDLFATDLPLREALARACVDASATGLLEFGKDFGSEETFDLGRLANQVPPRLHIVDAKGDRADRIEFHPAYHALMQKSMAAGLHCSSWEPGETKTTERAARLYMATQVEAGHLCPTTMTNAGLAALAASPELHEAWAPRILSRDYDSRMKPWFEKCAVTLGMGMTERQSGTDVRATMSQAKPQNGHYEITGHKWFMSAPMSDAFLVLAQAPGGLTCFLLPRFRPDGSVNALRFQRLKDKLGNRSNASSEVEFHAAYAERVGAEGEGVRSIIRMVQLTRLDCAVAAAGQMRMGLAQAAHHARHRSVFQRRLMEQPAMRAVLADLALESEANTALVFRLTRAYDRARRDEAEAAYARLMTPAVKYLVAKSAPSFIYETLECLGGNGYVEDLPMARLYREAPLNAIWEGSGTVMALDVLRAFRQSREAAEAVIDRLAAAAGAPGRATADAIKQNLDAKDLESRARFVAEKLARLGALAALHEADGNLAEAYAATRLQGAPRATWGASDLASVQSLVLSRALSQ
ncbi:acyl-CoA dehydrogenase family protein [Methylocapsa polymorpha]|uniref:Acyl-CoA dehydrogenase family protein n=1 Tax=Methylocapsa polymorpha TaxID=3080828 RepID=A0ABZ0HQJ6_9HYPH|nr:acyl-CoA dehydrogenase family protein [Methylocapsa sp. RX1]